MQLLSGVALASVACVAAVAAAQTVPSTGNPPDQPTLLPEVEVVAPTPLLGSGVNRNTVPAQTQVLTGHDVTLQGPPSATRALEDQAQGVHLDNSSGNPFQPDLFYHGFEASPLQGTPAGIAVYVNGARFNNPFGDTVNWDLIPNLAIDRMNLEGANPVFGLNALGGALNVQLKNGFTYHGGEVDLYGGSFGQIGGDFQYGKQSGNVAVYVAGSGLHEAGWRDAQSSGLKDFYGDIGWRGEQAELHVNVDLAQSVLNGPGTVPVELLDADPRAQFTGPNWIKNTYARIGLNGNYDVTDTTSLQVLGYYDNLQQVVGNGNGSPLAACGGGSPFLCEAPGVVATDRSGNPIPAFLGPDGLYGSIAYQTTNTNGYGTSVQVTNSDKLFGHANQLVAGLSFDGANTLFDATTEEGGLDLLTRNYLGPGTVIDLADGSIIPVRADIVDAYYGVFFTDTFSITPRLSANLSGRFNAADIDITDLMGGSLTGNHVYNRFNPAAGLTYRLAPGVTLYGGYAEFEPRTDAGGADLLLAVLAVQPGQFLHRRSRPQAGRGAHLGTRRAWPVHALRRRQGDLEHQWIPQRLERRHPVCPERHPGHRLFRECRHHAPAGRRCRLAPDHAALARLDRLFLYRRDVPEQLRRIEPEQSGGRRERQHHDPPGRPVAGHSAAHAQARGAVQGDRQLDRGGDRRCRQRAIPVRRRSQPDAETARLFPAGPEHELPGQQERPAVRAGAERARRKILHLRHVLADHVGPAGAGAERHQHEELQHRRPGRRLRRRARDVLNRKSPASWPGSCRTLKIDAARTACPARRGSC